MVSLTLSVPPELKKRMDRHPEIRWSNQVRAIIAQQLDDLETTDRLASRSQLTEKDVEELAAKVDAGMAKRWKEIRRVARR
ncbi:hypothetical protein HY994_02795 [Candidatus Micrarchaeota archaeon]|nr:hypothetical protein [Candidatus Micrarchaeota archaeon]